MIEVRSARPGEAGLVRQFINELADYEKLSHEVKVSERGIEQALFGAPPRAHCDLAFDDERAVGFALWFYTFSTFVGRPGIWLEDLFVRPEARGRGVGKALMAGLARRCADEKLGRLEWEVLDWNAPAIEFYDALGAETQGGWTMRRLTGEALNRLAEA